MRCHIARCKVDPVLAPEQFSVARPLRPEDLDRRVTRQGVYPSIPAPNGVPWSEYVRTQRNKPPSVSSSTETLVSDHARYVTRKIAQHAQAMATGIRSLPTNSPVLYFQLIERGYMLECSQEGIYATPYIEPSEHTINVGGIDYQSEVTEIDRVSTFTGLDDYDTLFAARHGRGALDPVPKIGGQISFPIAGCELINPKEKGMSIPEDMHIEQKETLKLRIASPSSELIGEGAAIFTDMTETILDVLDKQTITSNSSQQHISPLVKRSLFMVRNLRILLKKTIILTYFYPLGKITG